MNTRNIQRCIRSTLLGVGLLGVAASLQAQEINAPQVRLAQALLHGEQASQGSDRRSAEQLASAARVLARMGAKPAAGEPDLVAIWSQQAVKMGARPVALPAFRGRIQGPAYRKIRIAPSIESESNLLFLAGQPASVTVAPIGASQVEMRVLTGDDRAVCDVIRGLDSQQCNWMPVYTQRFRVLVRSQRGAAEAFVITN